MATNPKVAVAYIRVSTDDQALGPEAQRRAIELWAERQGVQIDSWHFDDGVSGATPLSERKALLEAIAALQSANAGTLVAAKRCRLARDPVVASAIESTAKRSGAVVRTADGLSDTEGSGGYLTKGVFDLFAAHERLVIGERTKAALAVMKARGERVGRVPYGFSLAADGIQLVPQAEEQAVLARIRQLSDGGVSSYGIVRALNAEGIASRSGKPWIQTQIYRLITRAA